MAKVTTQKVYDFIANYKKKHDYAPTFRDIASSLDIKSTSTIFYHIKKLVSAGVIGKESSKYRALQILNKPASRDTVDFLEIPVIGKVAAGTPILATENINENLYVNSALFSGTSLFSLIVKGDSMVDAGILSGDTVIVNQQPDAENGEIVVAMMGDEATVKRLYKEKKRIRLQPENDKYEPIYTESVVILGKVVGLIRNM